MTKRHHSPAPPPTAPSATYAAVHRLFAVMAGQPLDPFAGCSFPACDCSARCAIYDGGPQSAASRD